MIYLHFLRVKGARELCDVIGDLLNYKITSFGILDEDLEAKSCCPAEA